jgi:Mrp family chromosome partitioning ATPase
MALRDYLQLVRERIVLVLLITLVVVGVDAALTFSSQPDYQASVRVLLLPQPALGGGSASTAADLGTEGNLVTSNEVAASVRTQLGLDVPLHSLESAITVSAAEGSTSILIVQAESSTRASAIALTNAFAERYLAVRAAEQVALVDQDVAQVTNDIKTVLGTLQSEDAQLTSLAPTSLAFATVAAERDNTQAELVALQGSVQTLTFQRQTVQKFGEVLGRATQATAVRSRALDRTILFGVLIGVPLGVAVVLLLDSFRDVLRGRSDVEQGAGVEVLGAVPFEAEAERGIWLFSEEDPLSSGAESYRSLALTVRHVLEAVRATVLVVTSAGPGEGRTTLVTNLALSLAEAGNPVALVEADIRRPKAYEALGADYVPGLAELLRGDAGVSEVLQRLRSNLTYVGPGVLAARAELLLADSELEPALREIADGLIRGAGLLTPSQGSQPARERLGETEPPRWIGPRPIVLVDAGAVLEAPEALMIAGLADAVLLVARPGVSTRQGMARAAEQLKRNGSRLLGAVLIGSRSPEDLGIVPVTRGLRRRILRDRLAS